MSSGSSTVFLLFAFVVHLSVVKKDMQERCASMHGMQRLSLGDTQIYLFCVCMHMYVCAEPESLPLTGGARSWRTSRLRW